MLNCYPLGFYHPATLVKDAEHHRVRILPITSRIGLEMHDRSSSLRLGLKYVAGMRAETGLRIERERRAQSFESIADFTARVAPNKRELDAIAYAGAFAEFGLTRREALWQAAAVERDPGEPAGRRRAFVSNQ